ncbi:NAD-dependent epimerase/dehydratase family protein [Pedobacter aquatilis]|uniref:NAD-dependent epimerase/dehydratase family protein n=1 Tax=Pedobacter aquatilis TaxID=351343 RepID=UPI00293062E3|nr:NAD-dependent epimerase/dehydratase family protein [Pedobacter aquatilis]
MNILILGSSGFIGKNLVTNLSCDNDVYIAKIDEDDLLLIEKIQKADVIINAAGVSRSEFEDDFFRYNIYHSQRLFSIINKFENKMYIYFSSIHFGVDSLYGFSKRYNEFLLRESDSKHKNQFLCLRIPSIFGPGVKPDYVSVVATFCNNVATKRKSEVIDGNKILSLLYIDDLINFIKEKINNRSIGFELVDFFPFTVEITVNALFETINAIGINKTDTIKENKFLNNLSKTYNFYK